MKTFLIGLIISGIATIVILKTQEAVDNWWQNDLAKRGVAEYYLDSNNQRQWHMKEGK